MLGLDELPEGALLELDPLAGGVLEPLAAPLEGAEEPLAPPEAESFFVASADEEELEDDGELGGVAPALLDEDPGELGGVLTEPDAELEPDGVEAEPDGVVVEPLDEEDDAPVFARSPALSPQAVSMLAPKTIDTATAKVESLMLWPPWLG